MIERVVALKKIIVMLILIISVIAVPATAFANNGDKTEAKTEAKTDVKSEVTAQPEPVPFTFLKSEKGDFQPENEYSITFEGQITINAESVKGATVVVTVSFDESLGVLPEVYDEVVIGASQKFIQPVALRLGDNFIEIAVEKDGYVKNVINTVVKRKDVTILESLQKLIVIPGR